MRPDLLHRKGRTRTVKLGRPPARRPLSVTGLTKGRERNFRTEASVLEHKMLKRPNIAVL